MTVNASLGFALHSSDKTVLGEGAGGGVPTSAGRRAQLVRPRRLFLQGAFMEHEPGAGGLAVEAFREYLLLLARLQLGDRARARVEASDVVQQTLLEAHRRRGQFRGRTAGEMAAWLRRMLACNLADALRALTREKRDVARERPPRAAG